MAPCHLGRGRGGKGAVHKYWPPFLISCILPCAWTGHSHVKEHDKTHNHHNHHKVSELKGAPVLNVSRFGGVTSPLATTTWQSDHDLWDETFGGRIRSCRVRSLPLHH